jgi:hypothetical protein
MVYVLPYWEEQIAFLDNGSPISNVKLNQIAQVKLIEFITTVTCL